MQTIAYLRVSTEQQDIDSQKLAVLDYAQKNKIKINDFIQSQVSSRKAALEQKINEILEKLNPGYRLIVSELSRLGRSLGQIIRLIDELVKKKIRFVAIKENIIISGKQTIQNKVMISMLGLFAEIERDLISERTKQGLAAARAKGKLLGRPKGTLGKSRLNGKEEEIKLFLSKGVSKASIAKIMDISRTALVSFIKNRKLE